MYWYRKLPGNLFIAGAIAVIFCVSDCKPDIKETGAALKYFDIKGFFTAEAMRLDRLNTPVVKTVTHNGVTQHKKVRIGNWERELDLFIGSDINRPAWKDSYTVTVSGDIVIYRAKDPKLKMRQIDIKRDKDKVKWILIFNRTKNLLYETTEKLSYFPDSLYSIEKYQHVKLMGNNTYSVQGLISQ
ncbi:MAG: hypothetical protein NVSMB24_00510 [Mucilaginibacter sp.]